MGRTGVLPSVLTMTNDDVAAANTPGSTELSAGRRRLRRFPVPVLIVALAVVLVATRAVNSLVEEVPILALLVGIGTAVAAIACYRWLSCKVEARGTVEELAPKGRRSALWLGFLLGCATFTATLLII